jgi:hypothetical protein
LLQRLYLARNYLVIVTIFEMQMDNVLQDMVQRLRAIELLLRTQNELLTRMLADLEQTTDSTTASNKGESQDRERFRKRA